MKERLHIDPEQALPLAAILLGVLVGGGIIASTSVPGCASEQCAMPEGVELPASVLECPTGTLCYQGACVPSCASGAENQDKCESDDDCTSAARPNCVDRRCSSCEQGERCVPALNICSPVRGNASSDAGNVVGDAGFVSGVSPLDGGTIDGSVLRFDTGVEGPPPDREITHLSRVEIRQRTDLRNMGATLTSTIIVETRDIRGTARVVGSTVAPPLENRNQSCQIVRRDRFPNMGPMRVDMGNVQIEPAMASPGINGMNYTARFALGAYDVRPEPPDMLLIHSFSGQPNYVRVFGAGMPGITAGPWPPGAPEQIEVPDVLSLASETRTFLSRVIDVDTTPTFDLVWNRGVLRLSSFNVQLRIEGEQCILTCTAASDEELGRLTFRPELVPLFRNECGARGEHVMTVDRVSSRRVNPNSDVASQSLVELTVQIKDGFISTIRF